MKSRDCPALLLEHRPAGFKHYNQFAPMCYQKDGGRFRLLILLAAHYRNQHIVRQPYSKKVESKAQPPSPPRSHGRRRRRNARRSTRRSTLASKIRRRTSLPEFCSSPVNPRSRRKVSLSNTLCGNAQRFRNQTVNRTGSSSRRHSLRVARAGLEALAAKGRRTPRRKLRAWYLEKKVMKDAAKAARGCRRGRGDVVSEETVPQAS